MIHKVLVYPSYYLSALTHFLEINPVIQSLISLRNIFYKIFSINNSLFYNILHGIRLYLFIASPILGE